ncbi:head fiber protein [Brevibacillus formosus]|uniref:head fiber protein n=1 Tax=Brevibacillus formosus TaxID=54913 RepID=UPI003B968F46
MLMQYYDRTKGDYVTVTSETPLPTTSAPMAGSVGTEELKDSAVTTPKIADGAVTDDKLAKPKVDVPASLVPKMVIGTTLSANVLGMVGYEQTPTADHLAMYQFGGQLSVGEPQASGDAATKNYVDNKQYAASAITSGTFDTARIPTLAQSKITGLTTDLAAKLTATKASAQADSTATDVAGLVADFNSLLAKLRTAGILAQ